MPSAREIAEERYAKGEITEEEFTSILKNMSSDQNINRDKQVGSHTGQRIVSLAIFALSPILFFYFQSKYIDVVHRCGLFGEPPECMTSPDPITLAQINLVAGTFLPLIIGAAVFFWLRRS